VTLLEKFTAAENWFLDKVRSEDARRVATDEPSGSIDAFAGRKYCVLVTYKRDGTPVPSPLWFGRRDNALYVHTGGWKVQRIRNNPAVRVAPSTFRGRPLAPPVVATARVLERADEATAEAAIQSNYGWTRVAYYRLFGGQEHLGRYIEIVIRPQSA